MASDGLFIIGSDNFDRALNLGLYPALAYLVMARGTQRNNVTTSWSAKAVKSSIGVRWPKCQSAIQVLIESGLASLVPSKVKSCPRYRLAPIEGDRIFLPNTLVDGSKDCTPPLRRIRESQSIDVLKLLISLYQFQNLADEHGIKWEWFHRPADVEYVMDLGQFKVWIALPKTVYRAYWDSDLARPWRRNTECFWDAIKTLDAMGLIERAWYVADADGELLYPFTAKVESAISDFITARDIPSSPGWSSHLQFLTLRHQSDPQFIGLYRTTFRTPHSSVTGQWLQEREQMEADILRRVNL